MSKTEKAVIIGGGFAGLSSAALLAQDGYQVTLLEKNSVLGGRARLWKEKGFTFDMGPSWYLMPEVFDHFFSLFGEDRKDWYSTHKLDTFYKVFFDQDYSVKITSDIMKTRALFDSFEEYGGEKLIGYLEDSKYKYDTAMKYFLYRDYSSIFQFFNRKLMFEGLRLNVFDKLDAFVSRYFSDPRSKKLLEYAMVFLGTSPYNAPALYSIMSHVDLNLGVFFPDGGLGSVALAMAELAKKQGAKLVTNETVTAVKTSRGKAVAVETEHNLYDADLVLSTADYEFTENRLLEKRDRSYSKRYWNSRVLAPSMFIMYLGIGRALPELEHHNLYLSKNWDGHFDTIFDNPAWPEDPCFYLSRITKTEKQMAPKGAENIFVLVPVASGLDDSDDFQERYAKIITDHIQRVTGVDLTKDVLVRRLYSHKDFKDDYNAFKGTALGLAHTLFQTAVFRPSRRSKKVKNLYYSGQYTHPGVGVPMTLISSILAAETIKKNHP